MSTTDWWNRTRYRLYAPVYDVVARPFDGGRERAIERLDPGPDDRVLLLGSGTGLDLEHLPTGCSVTAVDVTEAMAKRTEDRADRLGIDVDARVGDARSLSFEDDAFDVVLLHLILSVAPDPADVVAETARVLTSDGRVSIYDKFVPDGSRPSLLRRALNPLARFAFSDLTRSLEPMLSGTSLAVGDREPFLGGVYVVTIARPEHDG